jgi:rhomboid protease GluP
MIGPSSSTLLLLGAKYGPSIRYNFEFYRLFTPIFMHSGILHIFFNLMVQLTLGLSFEKQWKVEHSNRIVSELSGTLKMILIYIVSGVGSSLLSCVILYRVISVGASGKSFLFIL